MRGYFILISVIMILAGCQSVQSPPKPDDLIPKDKMIDILEEAYLANAARGVENKSILEKGIRLDSLIYDRNGIDSLQFARSNAYYSANLNVYSEIFRELETRLSLMQKELDSVFYSEKPQQDSKALKKDSIK